MHTEREWLQPRDKDPDGSAELALVAYREILDASSDALFVHDESGRILLVNAQVTTLYGWTAEEAVNLSIADLSSNEPPYTQSDAQRRLEFAIAHGTTTFEWRGRRKGGACFWCEATLRPFRQHERMFVIATIRDIDDRKRAEFALRESEERFATIFNATSTMMSFTEPPEGKVVDVNDAWLRGTGLTRAGTIGKTGREIGMWPDLADRDKILRMLEETGRAVDVECEQCLFGKRTPTTISAEYIEMRGKRFILWEIRDLSERKRAEEEQGRLRGQLMQAQKMESVGLLAGGIAHDFNNILSVILGFTTLAMRETESTSQVYGHLAQVLRASERAADLTRKLLTFSRKQVVQPRLISPKMVIEDIVPMLRHLLGQHIQLIVESDETSGGIWADASHLEQALMNLVVNARDAMPDGGTVTLRCSDVDVGPEITASNVDAKPGPHVLIVVTDTGVGMDAETQAHAFEPFFTTKGVGRGTGLGLSSVYGTVQQCGGFLRLSSEPGRGTSFQLYFPRSKGTAAAASAGRRIPFHGGEGTTVLVVDDESQIRALVRAVLSESGYTVVEASGGHEALALATTFEGEIHILLTDMLMPRMKGEELAEQFALVRPTTRVLFMSGYSDSALPPGTTEDGADFVAKPLTPEVLLTALSRVMARQRVTKR